MRHLDAASEQHLKGIAGDDVLTDSLDIGADAEDFESFCAGAFGSAVRLGDCPTVCRSVPVVLSGA